MASTSAPVPGHCANGCWKPETRYNTNVLLGNWQEERLSWHNYRYPINSSHRTDFRNFSSERPDKLLRLKEKLRLETGAGGALMKANAVGEKMKYTNYPYMVTWYDEDFNRKERPEDEKLPPLRNWDFQKIAWLPEKSDHPISHPPTNWGLTEHQNKRWKTELKNEGATPKYDTTYTTSYLDNDVRSAADLRRYAMPRELSVHFVPHNGSRLMLRNNRTQSLQIPEPPQRNLAEQIQATHSRVIEQGKHIQEQINLAADQKPLVQIKPCP